VQTFEKQSKEKFAYKKMFLVFTTVGFVLEMVQFYLIANLRFSILATCMIIPILHNAEVRNFYEDIFGCTRNLHSIPTKLEIYTKNSVFTQNIQPANILLLHIFIEPKCASSTKT